MLLVPDAHDPDGRILGASLVSSVLWDLRNHRFRVGLVLDRCRMATKRMHTSCQILFARLELVCRRPFHAPRFARLGLVKLSRRTSLWEDSFLR